MRKSSTETTASDVDRYAPTLSSLKLHRKLLLSSIESKQKRIQRELNGNAVFSQTLLAAHRGAAATRPTAVSSSLSAAYYSSRPASSEAELASLENELRLVAVSEEVRSRARVVSLHLCAIRALEEQRIVKDLETRARLVLMKKSQAGMRVILEHVALSREEVSARNRIASAASPSGEVVAALRRIQQNHIFESEASARGQLLDVERVVRSEVLARRIVTTLELLSGVPLAAASLTLRRQHEAENALGVETFHLIAQELRMRDVVVDSEGVGRCALLARMVDSWSRCAGVTALHVDAREFDRKIQEGLRAQERQNRFEQTTLHLLQVENVSRGEVERHEAATRFDLRVCAAREWKSIYSSSLSARRGLVLAQHVEKMERERLHREHRKQYSALVQRMWKREEQLRDEQRAREWLMADCAASVTALWKYEKQEFSNLLRAHRMGQLYISSLSALHIVTIDEERARVAVERTQLTETLRMHAVYAQLNFMNRALHQKRATLPAAEQSERASMLQTYRLGTVVREISELEMAEINERCAIEVASSRVMKELCMQQIQEAHNVFVEIPLFKQEAMARRLIEAEEQAASTHNNLSIFVEAEQAQRFSSIRHEEQRERIKLASTFCTAMEARSRRKIARNAASLWNTITKRCVGERVVISRELLETAEDETRSSLRTQLVSSSPEYVLQHALKAEEYRARLSIIAEAEVAANVGARFSLLFFPDIPHVSYKPPGYVETEGSRYKDAPVSLSAALASLAKCTTDDLEPKWRCGLKREWRTMWDQMYTMFHEQVERQRIVDTEKQEWSAGLMDVFQRVVEVERSQQNATATHGTVNPSGGEHAPFDFSGDIFSYLAKATTHEAGLAVKLALARRRVQRKIGPLLQDVFVQHTTLTLQERMEREHIEAVIHRRLQRNVNFEKSYLPDAATASLSADPLRSAGIRSPISASLNVYARDDEALVSYRIVPAVSLRYILLAVETQNSEDGDVSTTASSQSSRNVLKGQEHFMMHWERHEHRDNDEALWRSVESDATPLVLMQRVTVGQTELLTLAPLCEVSWMMNDSTSPKCSEVPTSRVTFSVRVPNLISDSFTEYENRAFPFETLDVLTGCVDARSIHSGEQDSPCVENDAPLEAARGVVSIVDVAYSDLYTCKAKLFLLENQSVVAELDDDGQASYHTESRSSTPSSLSQSIL